MEQDVTENHFVTTNSKQDEFPSLKRRRQIAKVT